MAEVVVELTREEVAQALACHVVDSQGGVEPPIEGCEVFVPEGHYTVQFESKSTEPMWPETL